jgi:hypothetical protein
VEAEVEAIPPVTLAVDLAEVALDTKLTLFVELLEMYLQYHLLKVCLVEMDQAEQELIILVQEAVELSMLVEMVLLLLLLVIQETVETEHQMILQVQPLIMLVAAEEHLWGPLPTLMVDKVVVEYLHLLVAQNVAQQILVAEVLVCTLLEQVVQE